MMDAGTIVAVGDQMPAARIGERVLVRAMQSIRTSDGSLTNRTIGSECDGASTEYAKIEAGQALPSRSDWIDLELASIPWASSTGAGMLERIDLGVPSVAVAIRSRRLQSAGGHDRHQGR